MPRPTATASRRAQKGSVVRRFTVSLSAEGAAAMETLRQRRERPDADIVNRALCALAEHPELDTPIVRFVVDRCAFIADFAKATIRPATQQAAFRACLGYQADTTDGQERATALRGRVYDEATALLGEPEYGWNWATEDGHPTYPLGA